jgi:hypothetical protein
MLQKLPFPKWTTPALAILHGSYAEAARLQDEMGHRLGAAYSRLRAGGEQLHEALAFYRSLGANRYIEQITAQLGESA